MDGERERDMKHLIAMLMVLFCTRVGDEYPGHFICTDKDETFMQELNLSKLRAKPIPEEWTRVKLNLYPFRPIMGKSIWPFWGYRFKNISDQYNNGKKFNSARR